MVPNSFQFVVITDLHLDELQGIEKFINTIEYLQRKKDVAFIQILGDICCAEGPSHFKRILEGLGTPFHLTYGNHDAPLLREYHESFGAPNYSFEYGNCLFVSVFNAFPAIDDPHAIHGFIDQPTWNWCWDILHKARSEKEYAKIFLFAHVPPMKPGSPMGVACRMDEATTDQWYDLCREFAVDAAFYGHMHFNEVFELDDTWHITTPSLNWNFNTCFGHSPHDWVPVEYNGYRIVTITNETMTDEIYWCQKNFSPIPDLATTEHEPSPSN